MKIFQVSLLIGLSTMMVACPGMDHHPRAVLKWDDPRILRGTYAGEYGTITDSGFQKVGTLKFQFTPRYVNENEYRVEGFIQLNDGPQMVLKDARVRGNDTQEYLQPQHSATILATFWGTAVEGTKTHDIRMALDGSFDFPGWMTVRDATADAEPASTDYRFKIARLPQ